MLVEKSPTHAVMDVGGVGYGLSISLHTFDRLPAIGVESVVHTHTYVREDRLQLFGFADPEEREMFEMLIGVSGIGPNSAQTILSGMSVADLQLAIHREQVTELTKVRGIGTKTAQRVVVDLKDKIRLPMAPTDSRASSTPARLDDPIVAEATLALEKLGIATSTARKAVDAARKKQGSGPEAPTVQDLIKGALRER